MAIAGYHYQQNSNAHIKSAWDNSARSTYSPTENDRSAVIPPCNHCAGRKHTEAGRSLIEIRSNSTSPVNNNKNNSEKSFKKGGGWAGLAKRNK